MKSWSGALGGYRLVLVNGAYAPQFSGGELPAGVHVSSLRSVLATNPGGRGAVSRPVRPPDRQAFTGLNTGFLQDGAFVWIPPGTIVEQPILLLFVSVSDNTASVSHPRVLIVAGDRSQARIVESYVGPPGQEYFTNALTEVAVGDGAVVDHYKLQRESQRAYHIGSMYVHGTRDSTFSSHSIAFGGALVRNDVIAVLDGEGGDYTLNGLYVADGRRLIDNHTTIDHAKPHCGSHEVYKGILSGHARAVFNGKIIVRPDAQKTDAKQTNKALPALRRCADQYETATRDFRQRREVYARRGCGSARRGRDLLSAGTRPRPAAGARHADPRVRGRRVRPDPNRAA